MWALVILFLINGAYSGATTVVVENRSACERAERDIRMTWTQGSLDRHLFTICGPTN